MSVTACVMFLFKKFENSLSEEINSMYRNSVVGKGELQRRCLSPRQKWKNNIEMVRKQVGKEDMDWNQLS
jgi:hypothetical protein